MKVVNKMELNLLASLNLGVPPVLASLNTFTEATLKDIDNLAIHNVSNSQCITERSIDLKSLYHVAATVPQSFINVQHDPVSGTLIAFTEEGISEGTDQSSKHSLSLDRRPCPLSDGIRGNIANCPFLPGGFELKERNLQVDDDALTFKDLLKTPPNFTANYEFERTNLDWLLLDQSDLLQTYCDDGDKDQSKICRQENSEADEDKSLSEVVIKLEHRLEKASSQLGTQRSSDAGAHEFVVMVDLLKPIHNFHQLVNPVISYPFELDTFQKQAVLQMEAKHNVFVAAHTSAGKTVVAEYAIALALNHMTKAIYTSPIKALSNQKFRDFKEKFGEVGLVTGDIQLNPKAPVLIMTTEILRSMLYNGSDVIRDLEWVIFDEVHYINDPERGVVWEEVLILLPASVKIVLLSATVPNCKEFAEWVGRIKKKQVYVISTLKRPVPLEHFLYTGNSPNTCHELFLLVDSDSKFQMPGYNSALEAKKKRASKSGQQFGGKKTNYAVKAKQEQQIWSSLISHLDSTGRTPAVAFVFSKRRIDENSSSLNKLDLLDSRQKSSVLTFFKKSIRLLKPVDQRLPQVRTLQDLLQRGIGIHHSGVLPILKEVVEMLFQRGLVKVLFATETFAMGVNMPAKTVIFDSIEKHDGDKMRELSAGEYIQMAGRAGRRGLDKTGTVIILCKNEVPEVSSLHKMMMGQPTMLTSKFRVTYLMVLSLLRVEELRVEDMMRRSFGEFLVLQQSMQLEVKVENLKERQRQLLSEEETDLLPAEDLSTLPAYYHLLTQHHTLTTLLRETTYKKMNASKVLTAGRVVVLKRVGGVEDVAGVVLACRDKVFSVFVLCDEALSAAVAGKKKDVEDEKLSTCIHLEVYRPREEGGLVSRVVEVKVEGVKVVCSKVLKVAASQVLDDVSRRRMMQYSKEQPLQPVVNLTRELKHLIESGHLTEMKLDLSDPACWEAHKRLEEVDTLIPQHPLHLRRQPSFLLQLQKYARRMRLEEQIRHESQRLQKDYLTLFPEYHQRLQVLKSLKFVDKNNIVCLKGRVACEVNVQELLVTELIFQNTFSSLSIEVIAALLSCLVFQQSRCSQPNLSPLLKQAKESLLSMARHLSEVQRRHGIMVDDLEEQCNCGLMEVIHEWALGVPFAKLVELTDVQEGVIVKCIQRLDDLFQDLVKVAKVIGDPMLSKRMEEGSRLIRRDIVFAASLYLQ